MPSRLLKKFFKKNLYHQSPNKKALTSFYSRSLEAYEPSFRSVGWSRESTQQIRFMVLSLIADLQEASVLDCGCGTGDLFAYLSDNGFEGEYTGIDICKDMVQKARLLHPGIRVQTADIFSYQPTQTFDYILGSGLLSFRVDDPYAYVEAALKKMWSWTKQGLGVNFLSAKAQYLDRSKRFFYYEPDKILRISQKLSPFVELRHQYLANDFTVFIYKQ